MFRRRLDDSDSRALSDAVSYVESVSAVELVVVMRRHARPSPHAGWIAGVAVAWGTLALLLFSPPAFPLWSFLVDPVLVGAAIGWAVHRVPAASRWCTPVAARRRRVHAAASEAFLERGVHATRGRTGVLVYAVRGDGLAAVIADTAVVAAVTPARLDSWRAQIEATMTLDTAATAAALAAMAPVFAAALPHLRDDRNELSDAADIDDASGDAE